MIKKNMESKKYRIFILGAGFSKPAGFPLASDLWVELRRRAQALSGRAAKFHDDLRNYLDYKRECDGKELSEDQVQFEDFMRFLDVEHFLGLRGSDTWSQDGNEGTVVVKTLIGQILAELTPRKDDIPNVYLDFAQKLQPDDCVLTFNYDVLLERALEAVRKPYRLFPKRYKSVYQNGAEVDDSKKEVIVLKLHGSIDWFDRSSYTEWEQQNRSHGLLDGPAHPVFCTKDDLNITKLLDGPRHIDDPLNQMYRVGNIKALYKKSLMFMATPWMLAPSTIKIIYANKLKSFWHGLGDVGLFNFGLAIVGYSLPFQDEYARQAVYSIIKNYQQNYWDEEVGGMKKSPLVIVDYFQNDDQLESFKQRYRFVDWERAVLCKDGFSQKAVNLIFNKL